MNGDGGELDALQGEATRIDGEATGAGRDAGEAERIEPEQPKKPDYVTMLADLLNTAAGTLGVVYPFVPKHFTPEQNAMIAHSWIALADAYGLDLSKLLGRAALWLMAISVTGMPSVGIYAEIKKAREAAAAAAPAAPANDRSPAGPAEPISSAELWTGRKKK